MTEGWTPPNGLMAGLEIRSRWTHGTKHLQLGSPVLAPQVDGAYNTFSCNVVVASRTKGKRNREVPMDVLDERVKPVLLKLCENKKADEFVFVNPKTKKPYIDVKKAFATACDKAEVRNLEWHDLRATFCTRLAIAGYDAFTIKALMGHRDMKTTERYIRAHRLTRQLALIEKMSTNWPQTESE